MARALAGGFAVAYGDLPSEAKLLRRIPTFATLTSPQFNLAKLRLYLSEPREKQIVAKAGIPAVVATSLFAKFCVSRSDLRYKQVKYIVPN